MELDEVMNTSPLLEPYVSMITKTQLDTILSNDLMVPDVPNSRFYSFGWILDY